jgi:hypothetical protein
MAAGVAVMPTMSAASAAMVWSRLSRMGASFAAPRLSSSAKADDPVITGREEVYGFGLETHLHVLLDARFRGHDSEVTA